jgi:energy-coupling factor transport system substrate-specific component
MKIHDIVLIGLLSAATTAGKLALSFLPNIEVVTLFFIIFTTALGLKRSLLIAVVFVTTEILLYGFSTWVIGYYLIWPLLVLIVSALGKKARSEYSYAILGALFGFFYGMSFAITESFFYGPAYGFAYWINGLTFDLVHGASNFVIILLLFKPLKRMMDAQAAKLQIS